MTTTSSWMRVLSIMGILFFSGCASLSNRNDSSVASLPELSTGPIADSGASPEASPITGTAPSASPEASPSALNRKIYESEAVKLEGGNLPTDNGRDWNVPAKPDAPPSIKPESSPLPASIATPDIGIVKGESSDALSDSVAQSRSVASQTLDRTGTDLSSSIESGSTRVADPLEIAMGPTTNDLTGQSADTRNLSVPNSSGLSSTYNSARDSGSDLLENTSSLSDAATHAGSTIIEDPFSPVASSTPGINGPGGSNSFPEIGSSAPALSGTTFPQTPSQPTAPSPSVSGVMRGGQPAPIFTAVTLDGSSFDLASNRGRVVVLDFWRKTCGPCLKAMPKLAEVRRSYGEDKLVILGLNTDERRTEAETFLRQHPHNWRNVHVLSQKANLLNPYMVRLLPTFVVIDQVGNIQYRGGDINQVASKVAELVTSPSLPNSSFVASLR